MAAIKISKSARQEHSALLADLKAAQERLDAANSEFIDDKHMETLDADQLKRIETERSEAVAAYNEAVENINEFISDTAVELREQFDEKSEKWQESEAGEAADSFISEWEHLELSPADEEDGDYEDLLQEVTDLPMEPTE